MQEKLVLNNIFAGEQFPEKIKLLPPSPVTGRDGREFIYSAQDLVENFAKFKQQIPIDINHATELKAPLGEDSPAMGWITELEVDFEGGIWGIVAWTSLGESNLYAKTYKYISPAFLTNKNNISTIISVGLTNSPNLYLPALNNRCLNNTQEVNMEKILNTLGLSATATEEEALKEINSLKAQVVENAKEKDSLVDKVNKLNIEFNNIKTNQFNTKKDLVIKEAVKLGKILPATESFYQETIKTEVELNSFNTMLEKQPSILTNLTAPDGIQKHTNSSLTPAQKEICSSNGFKEEDFAERRNKLFGN